MRELVRGYASAVFETAFAAGKLDEVVSDLAGFSRVLSSSEPLRHALTDSSLPTSARRDVVVDLLSGKATGEATALMSFTVRVERAPELPMVFAALLGLSEIALEKSHSGNLDDIDSRATRSAVRERIRGYVERVLQELAALHEVDEVEDELFRFARLLDDNVELRRTLGDPNVPYESRAGIVSQLLEGRTQSATVRLTRYVIRAGPSRDLVGTFEWLVDLAAEERGRRVAEVRSAVDLDDAERDRLASALGRLVERPVEVRTILDPSVIGGVLISVGDLIIDGTVRIRFERLRDSLAQAS